MKTVRVTLEIKYPEDYYIDPREFNWAGTLGWPNVQLISGAEITPTDGGKKCSG